MSNTGVISMGVRCPIIRQGDDLKKIVIESITKALEENGMQIDDKDVIGITESVVARAQGNYVTIDDIVKNIEEVTDGKKDIVLIEPIMSRNRFSLILRAFARYANKITIVHAKDVDQQGNPVWIPNPFSGVDIDKYYKQICDEENCQYIHVSIKESTAIMEMWVKNNSSSFFIDARCHPELEGATSLADFMTKPINGSGYNKDWGLLGSNKADEERLKLFPRKDEAQELIESIQKEIFDTTGKMVELLVYGDGNFTSPAIPGMLGSQINEWADPCNPAWTRGLDGTPNEIKIKAFADSKYKNLEGKELENAIKEEIRNNQKDLKNNMTSQGTTPRRYSDLLASLFDLTTGSGGKGTPITYCHNYFNNFAD